MFSVTARNNKLNEWRKAGMNCDVILLIDGQEFHAHKFILAAATEFFEKLFTGNFSENGKNAITLQNVDPDGFRLILDYIYTEEIQLNDDCFAQVLPLAAYYQIECLLKRLFYYVKHNICSNNGFYYYNLADSFGIRPIIELAKEFIRNNFLSCSNSAEFLNTTHSSLLEFIDSPVEDELERFKIIMKWVQYDTNERSDYLSDLIKHVCFAYISGDAMYYDVLDYQLIINNPEMINAIKQRRKLEQTVRIYGMEELNLIRVDIFNGKLEAKHVMVETNVNYDEFQVFSSVDAVYVSIFRSDVGNKLYCFKNSQWTFLENSNYNVNEANQSVVYCEKYKTIYTNNKSYIFSYNLLSKNWSAVFGENDCRTWKICNIFGSLVCHNNLIYMAAFCTSNYYRVFQYNPCNNTTHKLYYCTAYKIMAWTILDDKMFIINDDEIRISDINTSEHVISVNNEKKGISYCSLIGYQNQLYAVQKKWDVIDVFDLLSKKWTKEIRLR